MDVVTTTTGRLITLRYGIGRGYISYRTATGWKAAITRILNRAGVRRAPNGDWPLREAVAAVLAANPARGGAPTDISDAIRRTDLAKMGYINTATELANLRAVLGELVDVSAD